MALILLFTDFDGTITKLPGSQVVFGSFYRSLLIDPPEKQYKNVSMKNENVVQQLFKEQFDTNDSGQPPPGDRGVLMTDEAIAFFRYALNNDEIKVHIISRNRDDYIRALFSYHGFSPAEISRLAINCKDNKQRAVSAYIANMQDMSKIYVLDDDEKDYQLMMQAVQHLDSDKIAGVHEAPGTFKWQAYLQQIELLLQGDAQQPIKFESQECDQLTHMSAASPDLKVSAEIGFFSDLSAAVNQGKIDCDDNAETRANVSSQSPK